MNSDFRKQTTLPKSAKFLKVATPRVFRCSLFTFLSFLFLSLRLYPSMAHLLSKCRQTSPDLEVILHRRACPSTLPITLPRSVVYGDLHFTSFPAMPNECSPYTLHYQISIDIFTSFLKNSKSILKLCQKIMLDGIRKASPKPGKPFSYDIASLPIGNFPTRGDSALFLGTRISRLLGCQKN